MGDQQHPAPAAGFPSEVTAANWQFAPYNRWGFSNCRKLLPTARIARSGSARLLPRELRDLSAVPVTVPGSSGPRTLAQVLEDNAVDGFLVLHRGRVLFERYPAQLAADQTHIVMSVSKSILGSLIGILVESGV